MTTACSTGRAGIRQSDGGTAWLARIGGSKTAFFLPGNVNQQVWVVATSPTDAACPDCIAICIEVWEANYI